jgi:hypothetical protein
MTIERKELRKIPLLSKFLPLNSVAKGGIEQ